MAKKVALLAAVIVLSVLCQSPAVSQQQSAPRSSVLGGSTASQQPAPRSSVLGGSTASQPSDALPPDFRGEITYTGTYSGSVKTKPDRMRNLSLGEGLRSLTSSQTLPLSGEYQLTVRYEGNRIYGAFVTRSATGPNGASIDPRGSFVGTRNGTTCTFTSEQIVGGKPAVGYCGRSRWEWKDDDVFNPQGHKVALRIVANQTGMVDFAERERQQAIAAAEQQRIAAERARKEQAEAARLAALPRASSAQAALLKDAIWQDSRHWALNRYDEGSLTNIKIDNASVPPQIRGDYTYNGGRSGWISGRLSGGRIECIIYHDTGSCSSVRRNRDGLTIFGETIRLSDYRWFEVSRRSSSDGKKFYTAVANIKNNGDKVNFLEYENSSFESLRIVEVDCANNRYHTVAWNTEVKPGFNELFSGNDVTDLTDVIEPLQSESYKAICSRRKLSPVVDPMATGRKYVRSP